jgi:uncharacterized ferritin-like protein (DUF455 family)
MLCTCKVHNIGSDNVRIDVCIMYDLAAAAAAACCQVAADEASHFSMLNDRLEALGSHYGALPAHDGYVLILDAGHHLLLVEVQAPPHGCPAERPVTSVLV